MSENSFSGHQHPNSLPNNMFGNGEIGPSYQEQGMGSFLRPDIPNIVNVRGEGRDITFGITSHPFPAREAKKSSVYAYSGDSQRTIRAGARSGNMISIGGSLESAIDLGDPNIPSVIATVQYYYGEQMHRISYPPSRNTQYRAFVEEMRRVGYPSYDMQEIPTQQWRYYDLNNRENLPTLVQVGNTYVWVEHTINGNTVRAYTQNGQNYNHVALPIGTQGEYLLGTTSDQNPDLLIRDQQASSVTLVVDGNTVSVRNNGEQSLNAGLAKREMVDEWARSPMGEHQGSNKNEQQIEEALTLLGLKKGMRYKEARAEVNKLRQVYHPDHITTLNATRFRAIDEAWKLVKDLFPEEQNNGVK